MFVLLAITVILSIALSILKTYQMDNYVDLLEQNGYEIELQESVYNGKDTKQATISKNYGHTWCYLYEFGNDNDAKRNMEYWANQETDNNIKPEYIVKSSRNYQKYVIYNEEQYVVLVRRDNFVFYGIGHTQYKEGIGSVLIQEGHKKAKELGYHYSVVLGSDKYYTKFGYIPAKEYGIVAPFDVPDENFMAIKLNDIDIEIKGIVQYAKEFGI